MANYLVKCAGGFWVLGEACVSDHLKASRIRYLAEAQETADALNGVGYCGGKCSVWQLKSESRKVTDERTGVRLTMVDLTASELRRPM